MASIMGGIPKLTVYRDNADHVFLHEQDTFGTNNQTTIWEHENPSLTYHMRHFILVPRLERRDYLWSTITSIPY